MDTYQLKPEGIGEKERVRVVDGNQAARIINRMHNQSVAANANVIVEYGKEAGKIVCFVLQK